MTGRAVMMAGLPWLSYREFGSTNPVTCTLAQAGTFPRLGRIALLWNDMSGQALRRVHLILEVARRPDAMESDPQHLLDCLIVGGGPAGLTAAIYLTRFHLAVLIADDGRSRAASIPRTHNHAGFPEGISGTELLARMRRQAEIYGARLWAEEIVALRQEGEFFVAETASESLRTRAVLLATGVVNRRPAMRDALHDAALLRGIIRYCPICDGYEVTDRSVGVLGTGERGFAEAEFLRSYTADVTLVSPTEKHQLSREQIAGLAEAGIALREGPCLGFELGADAIDVALPGGNAHFASLYVALGSDARSELAISVGAKVSKDGCLIVDDHQRTSVPGLYAAGDVVLGLDQISYSMGEGGVAATAIRNDLSQRRPLRR